MTHDDAEAARMAARVATAILDQAQDGTKLLTVHRHYPTGFAAFEVGAYMAMGATTGLSAFFGVAFLISKVLP